MFAFCIRLFTKVLGVREGDPGSSYISTFSLTDGDWPKVWTGTANTIHSSIHTLQDDAGSPCAGLAVCRCVDLLARPFHTLSSSLRPGVKSIQLFIWKYSCRTCMFQGYTSLGNPENTVRNPALAYTDPLGETRLVPVYGGWSNEETMFTFLTSVDQIILPCRFYPAHMLKDPAMERKGRLWHIDKGFRNFWQSLYEFTASFARPCWTL